MSLSLSKVAMKTALLSMAENSDDAQAVDAALDTFLSALETWISSSKLTIPTGVIVVTGTAASQTNPNPIVVDNALS